MKHPAFRGSAALAVPVLMLLSTRAAAQVDERLDVQTQVPQAYDRGRNVSVQQTKRPDYDPLGVPLGGFFLYPRVQVGAGVTSNTYLTNTDTIASPFVFVLPSALLKSNWSQHLLQLSATGLARDYIGQSRRNERTWAVDGLTRIDAGEHLTIAANGDVSRNFENAFSAEVGSNIAALSRYRRDFASVQATYTGGRLRTFLLADATRLRFSPIPLTTGGDIDQSDRNRTVTRLTGQVEYAQSPSLSFFAQLGGARTTFTRDLLTGGPNLDSRAVRLLGGANFDVTGRVRGTIGLGYSIQDYDAGVYKTVRGLSVDTRIEYFASPRLTVTGTAERTIENSALRLRLPFFNTEFSLRGDYELLRNVILNAMGSYSHQNYIGSAELGNIFRVTGGARYLASRRVNVDGSLSYRRRSSNNQDLINRVDETRFSLGIAYQL